MREAQQQQLWEENEKVDQWTNKLIPNLERQLRCKFGETGYYSTGHGSSKTYKKKIGADTNERCRYCEEIDSPKLMVQHCIRWEANRMTAFPQVVERKTVANVLGYIVGGRTIESVCG